MPGSQRQPVAQTAPRHPAEWPPRGSRTSRHLKLTGWASLVCDKTREKQKRRKGGFGSVLFVWFCVVCLFGFVLFVCLVLLFVCLVLFCLFVSIKRREEKREMALRDSTSSESESPL